MLHAAMAYVARAWPVFPVHSIGNGRCSCGGGPKCTPGKHPRSVHGFKDATTDPEQIRRWWTKWSEANIGVPTGALSGLVVWDVDPRNGGNVSLEELEAKHGHLPLTVEAITGGGGRHLVFAHPGGSIQCHTGLLPGIDIKADGGYFIVEPSLHISGQRYAWELSHHPDETPIAAMADWMLDLLQKADSNDAKQETERTNLPTESTEKTEPYGSVDSVLSVVSVSSVLSVSLAQAQQILEAIESTAPAGQGRRNDAVFNFARALKAIPWLAGAEMSRLRPITKLWHRRAYPVIGTKPFEETWIDFIRAYPRVQFPQGENPLAEAFARSEAATPPSCAANYESPAIIALIKLCRELQRIAGEKPFFLACRKAGSLLKIDHTTAADLLNLLVVDGVLRIQQQSTATMERRYRYLGGDR